MNSSNRLWILGGLSSVMLCFIAGVFLGPKPPPNEGPSASPTSLQDPDFSAPHKPDISKARKTPGPEDLPPIKPSTNSTGSSSLWVYQDSLPLYASQGLNQAVLERLPFATEVDLLEEVDDWVRVQVVGGQVGWLRRQSLVDRAPEGTKGSRPNDALKALQAYFEELNRHNYSRAYDALSSEFKRDLPYRSFASGYRGLDQIFMRVLRVQKLSPESQLFYVELLSEERPKAKGFRGEYVMVLEQARWRLGQATLREVDPRGMDPFPARTVPLRPAFADPTPAEEDDSFEIPE